MEELQLRLLEKQLTTKFFYFGAKRPFFLKNWWHHQKKVIALNMYIGTKVLVYERWLGAKSSVHGQPPGPTLSPFHRLTLLVHVSQIVSTIMCFICYKSVTEKDTSTILYLQLSILFINNLHLHMLLHIYNFFKLIS